MLSLTHVRICLFIVLGLIECLCAGFLVAGEPPTPTRLWRDMPSDTLQDLPTPPLKPWIIRERPIAFDPQLLSILKDAGARPHPPVTIELFDAIPYQLEIMSTLSKINDSAVIRGLIKSPSRGDVTFVVNGNVVAGTIQIGERLFKIEHVSNGRHRLLEVDPAKLPPD
jgi:hypothetical protein